MKVSADLLARVNLTIRFPRGILSPYTAAIIKTYGDINVDPDNKILDKSNTNVQTW